MLVVFLTKYHNPLGQERKEWQYTANITESALFKAI